MLNGSSSSGITGNCPVDLLKDLKEIEELKDANKVFSLTASLRDESNENKVTREVIWRILSHPYSKVTSLRLEAAPNCSNQVEELLGRWFTQVPVKAPRTLDLSFTYDDYGPRERRDDNHLRMCNVIRTTLELSKNGVEELVIVDRISYRLPRCELLLRPILENPSNELRKLDLRGMRFTGRKDVNALLVGLASPNCKVTEIALHGSAGMDLDEIGMLVDGLHTFDSIETLKLIGILSGKWLTDDNRAFLLKRLACVFARPGNKIRCLDLSWSELHVEYFEILGDALEHVHCRLEELFLDYARPRSGTGGGAIQTLISAVRKHNRLKLLSAAGLGCYCDDYYALGDALQSSNCKLMSINVGGHGLSAGRAAEAIAHALATCATNQLRELTLHELQPRSVSRAFARSMLSHNNKLTKLEFQSERSQDDGATTCELYRAARVSNVTCLVNGVDNPFVKAFNKPFLQVFYTLLSVKLIPRLGQTTWVRLLPMQDFIQRIAEVLDWPLGDLYVSE